MDGLPASRKFNAPQQPEPITMVPAIVRKEEALLRSCGNPAQDLNYRTSGL